MIARKKHLILHNKPYYGAYYKFEKCMEELW
jgi:hypothetical protein